MENIKIQSLLQIYDEDIKKAAWFYYSLWPGRENYDVDDLIQAGRIAVWNISEKRPEKVESRSYTRAAISYEIFGVIKQFSPKRKEIHLIRQYDEDVPLVDLLGVEDKNPKRFEELEELLYHIKNIFPKGEKYASNLIRLIESCGDTYDLNLSEPPKTELKDRVKIITKMDLSDEEMFVYAQVLLGTRKRFPRGYISKEDARERSIKYFSTILNFLEMSVLEFGQSRIKYELLRKYKLLSFLEILYSHSIFAFLKDVDVSIKLEEIFHAKNKLRIFASYNKYLEYLAQRKGFASISDYQEHLFKQKGFASISEHEEHLAKQRQKRPKNQKLSNLIKKRLVELGKTQRWLAKQLEITDGVISKYVSGRVTPRRNLQKMLFKVLELPYNNLDDLLLNGLEELKQQNLVEAN